MTSPGPELTDVPTGAPAVAWAELPEPVRRRLNGWAADALGGLPVDQIPVALRRIAKFAPTKRAKMGATVLSAALSKDPAFRGLVAAYVRSGRAGRIEIPIDAGDPSAQASAESVGPDGAAGTGVADASGTKAGSQAGAPTVDPITAAARAYLFTTAEAADLVGRAEQVTEAAELRGQVAELQTRLERAASTIEKLNGQLAEVTAAQEPAGRDETVEKLRGRLRDQGTQLRGLRDELAAAQEQTAGRVSELVKELAAARHSLKLMTDRAEAAKARADRAEEQVRDLQTSAADGRAVADRRIELLLNTIRDAQSGLRRELKLGANTVDPADAVLTGLPRPAQTSGRSVDAALLTRWLMLPQAHLIVDGYNITKTGYGGLTLADQRDRLVRDLSAIASRTAAEVTVVFDGAAVIGHQVAGRGVRVLFSPPGVIADEVIRRLVAAEPPGRVLVVASSDREIVTDVAARGARTVPASVLLTLSGH